MHCTSNVTVSWCCLLMSRVLCSCCHAPAAERSVHVHAAAAAAAGEDKEGVLDDEAIDDEEEAEAADEAALADVVDGDDEIKAADVDEDEIDAELAEELGETCPWQRFPWHICP